MHFAQLPDPNGWDVDFSSREGEGDRVVADDWVCTESGYVSDIHVWFSTIGDGDPLEATSFFIVAIWDDDTSGPYSRPGEMLWYEEFIVHPSDAVRHWGTGDQGWYDPVTGVYIEQDHENIYQMKMVDIADPFYQEEGTVYWLSVLNLGAPAAPRMGWKTADVDGYPDPYTGEHFMDDAVWFDYTNFQLPDPNGWQELTDPITGTSLDLAFVITPEPTTLGLLVFGGFALLRRRRG